MIAALALAACVPRANLLVLHAADLNLRHDVHALAVGSTAPETGPEGAMAREGALTGILAALQDAPGYRAWRTDVASDPVALCAREGADAVVVLSSVRAVHRVDVATDPSSDPSRPPSEATRDSRVYTSWSLIHASGKVLDELSDVVTVGMWDARSREGAEADPAGNLPTDEQATAELGFSAGIAYGRRIAPAIRRSSRPWFSAGDPRLRTAGFAVRGGDWKRAANLWRDVAGDAGVDAAIRARALHDLAMYYEVHGNPHLALRQIELAAAQHDSPRIRRYQALLRDAWARQRTLRWSEAAGTGEIP